VSEEKVRAVVVYWSEGGNTRKVAEAIDEALAAAGVASALHEVDDDLALEWLDYELVFLGAPVYGCLPPEPVRAFLKRQHIDVRPAAPERDGHAAVVFCTYGGGHTGVREAIPTLKLMGQHFEHGGIRVVGEWAVVGKYHTPNLEPLNTTGRLGDIRGRPNEHDLAEIRGKVVGLLRQLETTRDEP
jgi:flavorubredoxin